MKTALVTGAASGIVREIAYLLAKKGYSLILAAGEKDRLIETAAFVHKKYKVQAVVKDYDLSDPASCRKLAESCMPYNIDILVNGALGDSGEYCTSSELDDDLCAINTNISAVQILTKSFLDDMRFKPDTHILNVAGSEEGKGPVFSATRAYIMSISEGMSKELKEEGSFTSLSVLDLRDDAAYEKAIAKKAVKGMLKGRPVIKTGGKFCLMKLLERKKVE